MKGTSGSCYYNLARTRSQHTCFKILLWLYTSSGVFFICWACVLCWMRFTFLESLLSFWLDKHFYNWNFCLDFLLSVSVSASHLGRGLRPDIGVFTWFSVKIKEQVENISELDIPVTDLGMNASLFSRCHQSARTLPCLFKILYTLLPAGVIYPVTAQRYWAGDEHALVWLGYTHGGFHLVTLLIFPYWIRPLGMEHW